jgi:putative oxidoreductase
MEEEMSATIQTVYAPHAAAEPKLLQHVATGARVLLGLVFVMSGLSGFIFLFMAAPPPQAGLAGAFQNVFFRSHCVQFVDGVQLVSGALLLSNRYVTLALTLLGAVVANILVFHITMQPQTIPVPLVVLILWIILAYRYRANLAPLFKK